MSAQLWVVRAGREAAYVEEWRAGSAIAVNFVDFEPGDLTSVGETGLLAKVTNPAERTYAGQLISFAFKIEVGDIVVVPQLPRRRTYLVGEIISDYSHTSLHAPSGPHRRAVRWLGEFDRSSLSPEAVNTLGAIQTVFRPNKVEAELRNILTDLQPWTGAGPVAGQAAARPGAVSPQRNSPTSAVGPTGGVDMSAAPASAGIAVATGQPTAVGSAPAEVPLQVDVRLSGRGRATISCDHPALVMQQVPRHVDPDSDWRDVPGVYVLTGTQLQQTTNRTGAERTLTMTSIVRPWAYVGLSEKIFERLSSHRQNKEEWRRALVVRSGASPFSSDDIKYLEARIHSVLADTQEVTLAQAVPNGNTSAQARNPAFLDLCADAVVAVLRLTGTLI